MEPRILPGSYMTIIWTGNLIVAHKDNAPLMVLPDGAVKNLANGQMEEPLDTAEIELLPDIERGRITAFLEFNAYVLRGVPLASG